MVDAFRQETAYLGEREGIVGLDAVGQLVAFPRVIAASSPPAPRPSSPTTR